MAHIRMMKDKPRTLPWRAHINRKGYKPIVKMFKTRPEAEHWAGEQERSIRLVGLPLTIEDLKKQTVGDIVRRYLKEITPTKGCSVSETTVLKKFLKRDICYRSLAYVSKVDAYKYYRDRLKETWNGNPITPRTIRREINSIQHVFEVAKEQWGLSNLVNPFRGIKIKGSMHRRKRRLEGDELDRIIESCKGCRGLNKIYIPLVIFIAIDTGMRLQEIFNLTWKDIKYFEGNEPRRIEIRKSKTDHLSQYDGRTIVLPIMASGYLLYIGKVLHRASHFIQVSNDPIFPMNKLTFKGSWAGVVKRAKITDLHFHDLRREAGSRFDEAGLTKAEHDLMMGHANNDMTSLYINSDLKRIQDKLDKYALGGMTVEELKEAEEQGKPIPLTVGLDLALEAISKIAKASGVSSKKKGGITPP